MKKARGNVGYRYWPAAATSGNSSAMSKCVVCGRFKARNRPRHCKNNKGTMTAMLAMHGLFERCRPVLSSAHSAKSSNASQRLSDRLQLIAITAATVRSKHYYTLCTRRTYPAAIIGLKSSASLCTTVHKVTLGAAGSRPVTSS
jgi:hypothetical protein